jgi:hypothetical protein
MVGLVEGVLKVIGTRGRFGSGFLSSAVLILELTVERKRIYAGKTLSGPKVIDIDFSLMKSIYIY